MSNRQRRDSVALDERAKNPSKISYDETVNKLSKFYRQVKQQILKFQSPTTGLFPSDLGQSQCVEAHVRDSIYCAAAVWAVAQAYKRIDDDKGRTHELAQCAVKCMRGILECWLRQADKVEKFKQSQISKNALHSKFHIVTGDAITNDDEYEHLQIDCVALFLIFLVQMIQSGLQIIFTTDEVSFVQNLVFYVERAYRTPDFGMWERGSKYNNGSSELHASSIGLAKAALESINGENLFGSQGASWSVIFVDIDAHNRNRTIFDTILPRESNSKNTDASLIPTISWPAFAIHEEKLVQRTVDKALRKLKGRYGLKRFLRDGYGTVVEDKGRKYYKPAEIKTFDGIECEWPLFFVYLIIDSVYRGDQSKVDYYQSVLQPLLKASRDGYILPKYYYVEKENVEREKANPGSQEKVPSDEDGDSGIIFLWGQSVYIISQLLVQGMININELDPIRRYLPAAERPRPSSRYSSFQSSPSDLVIQVVLISESVRLQQTLATYGIQSQTPHQIEPIQIWPPAELAKAYEHLGVNSKLGLTGRPPRPIGGLGTAKLYRACGYTFVCYPLLFEVSDFYLSQDMEFVIDEVRSDLKFLGKCWKLAGRPTFCMIIREDNIRGIGASNIFELLAQFKRGDCDGTKVRLGRLQEFISSACIEHLDFLDIGVDVEHKFKPFQEKDHGKHFRSLTEIPKLIKVELEESWSKLEEFSNKTTFELVQRLNQVDNMYYQAQILQALLNREGLCYRLDSDTVEEKLEKLSQKSGSLQVWAIVRFCSSLLGKLVDSLAPSITAILVRGKQLTISVWGQEEEVIDKPVSPNDIKKILYDRCFPFDIIQAVLQQELIINIGTFMTTNPEYFQGILKIRIGWIVEAMKLEVNYACDSRQPTSINNLSPSQIKRLLLQVVKKRPSLDEESGRVIGKRPIYFTRQLDGALNRVPNDFYDRVWHILERTPPGLKVAGYYLPQQPTLSDMTQYELNFSLLVEQMLSKITDPAYRQMIVESFMVVDAILERNPEVAFKNAVDMDKVLLEAYWLYLKEIKGITDGQALYNIEPFYQVSMNAPHGTNSYIIRATMGQLLDSDLKGVDETQCIVS